MRIAGRDVQEEGLASRSLVLQRTEAVPWGRAVVTAQVYGRVVDWWAVGVLAWEMVTGENPFYHKNPEQVCSPPQRAFTLGHGGHCLFQCIFGPNISSIQVAAVAARASCLPVAPASPMGSTMPDGTSVAVLHCCSPGSASSLTASAAHRPFESICFESLCCLGMANA